MRTVITTLLLVATSVLSAQDFSSEISSLADKFANSINDVDDAEDVWRKIDDLVDDIEDALDDNNSSQLKAQLKTAEALLDFSATVRPEGRNFAKSEQFMEGARVCWGKIYNVRTSNEIVDIVRIDIGSYSCWLAKNKLAKGHKVHYVYKSKSTGRQGGSGHMGLAGNSYRQLDNSVEQSSMCPCKYYITKTEPFSF